MTQFRCMQCATTVRALSGNPECPKCGGLFEVRDAGEPTSKSAASWRKLFEARAVTSTSGVWMWKPWVLPELADKHVVTLGEGKSPLVDVDKRVFVKQCGQQPTGSFKDLGMTVLVSAAKSLKAKTLVCASTGDTSAALAAYGARAGIPVVVLLPKGKVSAAQLVQPLAHGARVIELDGDFDACMRVVADIGRRPGFFLANSKNPLRLLGQMTVAFEMVRDLGWKAPDVVVVPSGNLGNVYAMYRGFALLKSAKVITSLPKLVAAQVAAADPLHRAKGVNYDVIEPVTAGETLATAIRIGDPVSFPRARLALQETRGTTTSATEAEVGQAMRDLDGRGLLACPQTGAAWSGYTKLRDAGAIKKSDVVVVVSTASGLKFTEANLAVMTNKPARVAASAEAVAEVLGPR